MMQNFKISPEMQEYLAETQAAAAEAAKAEMIVMGINVPVGTSGRASILAMDLGKSKEKVDPKTKQKTGGHPMVTLTFHVNTPERWAGQRISRYFTLNASANQTVQQKYQRLYDFLELCGMPRELRTPDFNKIAQWAFSENREFDYEVAAAWNNPNEKEFKAMGSGNAQLPSTADLEKMTNSQSFAVGEMVMVAGNEAAIKQVLPDGKLEVKFANGHIMSLDAANVQKK